MLNLTCIRLGKKKVDHLAVPVAEDADMYTLPELSSLIDKARATGEFQGEKGQQVVLYDLLDGKVKRCLFLGLGPVDKIDPETLRRAAGRAVKASMTAKTPDAILAVPSKSLAFDHQTAITAMAEGAYLANHVFIRYKDKPKNDRVKKISLLVPTGAANSAKARVSEVETICGNTLRARDWGNTPANDKPPEVLAGLFQKAAQAAGLKTSVWNENRLAHQKFGALLAVSAGSHHPPRLVEMIYTPQRADKTIVLVGKGVTFDTGGISIKPAKGMAAMKADMAGAAAVAGTMLAVTRLKPGHRIIGITPLVENMPSGTAVRPGDIITSYSGKTIEVGNTDAEGRLILADAMAYAEKKYKPDLMIDLATLTGACVVALGEKIAGVFSRDKDLTDAILTAAGATHERCWPMPMPEDYKALMKSDYADISNNASSPYGGAVTAAVFLAEFVDKTRWAHIDIAGPGFLGKGNDYCGPGATGFGVRLLCALLSGL
ncbi:MAG: leucyl aminopeptidase [Desulfatitalea sp.]|nr:leucyl aminopeptidase [Desulfatitalea sp.]NNJ99261.1 leucyl aminopeptidase [Desulfatitalea sp.]